MTIKEIVSALRRGLFSNTLLSLAADMIEKLENENNRQKAEIERFKEECSCLGCENEWLKAHYKEIKAKAVKECIEKIKTRSSSCVALKDGIVIAGSRIYTISEVKLYEIEKEMVSEL